MVCMILYDCGYDSVCGESAMEQGQEGSRKRKQPEEETTTTQQTQDTRTQEEIDAERGFTEAELQTCLKVH